MRTPFVAALLGLLAAGLAPQPAMAATAATAATAASPKIFQVNNGINQFTTGKRHLLAVRAWRENFNAHSFDVVTFYETGDKMHIVPMFREDKDGGKEAFNLTVGGGADCLLNDFRLVKAVGKQPARLVVAERDMGDSYAATQTVHFTWYDLVDIDPDEDSVGKPALYFEAKKKTASRHKYCDVNEAFDKELHLGASGKTGGE